MTETKPRGLTRKEAMLYSGCKTIATFYRRIRQGLLPRAMPGTRTWDRKAIDAAFDKLLGTGDKALSPLQEWLANHARAA